MSNDPLQDIIEDAKKLVQAAAHPRKGTLSLSPETAARLESLSAVAAQVRAEASMAPVTPEAVTVDPVARLAALAETVRACQQCDLCEGRTQTVFAQGSPTAELVFVGEAPGEEEDRQGVPFVGPSGELLTDIITKGMKMKREDVYLCTVVKCRPPNSRDPLPEEKDACEPYLLQQLEYVHPKVICALGERAAQALLKTDESIGQLRGKWHFYHGIPVRVTYHPDFLLRSPGEKRKAWEDIQEVMQVLKGEFTPTP
jgi:uracil-DNA glycosylase